MYKTSDKLRAYSRSYWFNHKEECQENARILEEKCRREREEYVQYCAEQTGLSVKQIKKMQNDGWAIKEILAGHRKYGIYEPKTLIFI